MKTNPTSKTKHPDGQPDADKSRSTAQGKTTYESITAILEKVSEGFVAFDRGLNYTYVNERGCDLLRRKPEELIGKNLWGEYPEAKGTSFANAYLRALETQMPIQLEEYYEPWDRWFENRIYPSKDGLSVFFQDITERRHTDEQLKYQSQLLARVNDAVIVSNENFVLTSWNQAAERIYGWKEHEVVGKVAETVLKTEFFSKTRPEVIEEVKKTGEFSAEITQVKKDGTRIDIEARTVVIKDENGKVIGYVSVNRDISQRKITEEALRESEERYRTIYDTSGVSIWEEDFSEVKAALDHLKSQGVTDFRRYFDEHPEFVRNAIRMLRVIDVNEMTLRLYGAEDKGQLLKSFETIQGPTNLETFREEFINLAEGQSYFEGEVMDQTLQGKPLYLWRTIVFPKETAKFKSVLVCLTDITERKQVERALKNSEERFRALTENNWDAIALFGADGSILYGSPSTYRVLGYQLDEFVGRHAFEFIHEEDLAFVTERLTLSFQQPGAHIDVSARVRHKNGTWRWLEGVFTNLLSEPGVGAIVNNYHDFTERKQAQVLQGAIYQISEAANKAVDMDGLFRSVHEIIGQVMPARNFYISLYDLENDLLSFPYYVDEVDRPESASIPPARPGRGMTEYVLRTGKALLSDAANFEELAARGEVELVGTLSPIWVGAPLIIEGWTIGVIAMQDYSDPSVYTEWELQILEYVSGQVAKAIQHIQLNSDLQRRNRILSALQESTLVVMERRNLTDVLQEIVNQIVHLIDDTPNGFIYLVEPDGKNLKMHVGLGINSDHSGLMLRPGEGLAGKVWETSKPLVIQNYYQWADRSGQLDGYEIHAIAGVPLTSGSQCIGVIGVSYMDASRKISNEDVELLTRFAQLASLALENVRSYQSAKDELSERIRAEAALVEAEAKYRSLVERLPVVVYTSELGIAGVWHYVSPQIESLLGFTPEEWMADPHLWYQQIHPDDRDRQKTLEEQFHLRGEAFDSEYRIYTRDGRELWVRDTAHILPPREGGPPIVQGVLVDITERKRAEEALIASEETTRRIIDTALDAVITMDQDGRITRWNDQAESTFGWSRYEAVGQRLSRLIIPPDLRSAHERGLRHYVETDEGPILGRRIEITAQRRDASIFPVELTVHVLKNNGKVSFAAFVRDITERKRAEREMVLLSQAIKSMHESMVITDENDNILFVNQASEKTYGYESHELIGQHISVVQSTKNPPARLEQLVTSTRQGAWEGELINKRKDGSEFPVHLSTSPVVDEDGKIIALIGVAQDITERKQIEENLLGAELKYRTLVEQLPIMVYTNPANNIGSTTYVSPQIKPFLGYTQEEWLQDPEFWSKALHPEDKQRVLAAVEYINQNEAPFNQEYRMLARDGRVIWIRDQAALLRDSEGNPLLWQGLMIDITDRKQAEEALKSSETRYRLASRATNDVIWDLDMVNNHHIWNENVESLFGYTPEEASADRRWWQKHIHSEDREHILHDLKTFYEGSDTIWAAEYRFMRKDGSMAYITDRGYVERDRNGKPIRMIGAMSDISARKLAEDQIRRRVDDLKALRIIDMTITASTDLHFSLQTVLQQAISRLLVNAADILLLNPTTHVLEYSVGMGFHTKAVERSSVRIGEGYAGRAALERKIVHIYSLYESGESFGRRSLLEGEKFTSYYGVPLIAKGEVKGVLEIFHRTSLEVNQEWLDFLESVAGQAGLAIDNATLFQNLQRTNLELGMAYENTLEGWSAALDLRDKETEGHTLRVTNLTLELAAHMGLKEKDLIQIRRGALLHDIGKMGVPDRILLKPDNLTDDEWEIMRRHPGYAHEMLSRIEYLRPALGIPYCHHEKWDGSGYPRGLKGEQIPLDARIFAVVDVYDALTSDRPYRPAWTKERAVEYIKSLSGTQFDPRVVAAFVELLNRN